MASDGIAVFDFFCGCGGASEGFRQAGLDIVFGLDHDHDAATTFKRNFPEAGEAFYEGCISSLDSQVLDRLCASLGNTAKLFCGCAPCQPFTRQKTTRTEKDNRALLLREFLALVKRHKPEYVFIENVPGMQEVRGEYGPLHDFMAELETMQYSSPGCRVIAAQDYGVPQRRRRLLYIATRLGELGFPESTHGPFEGKEPYRTVRDAFREPSPMPAISAGQEHPEKAKYPNHRAAALSLLNAERIKATPHDGGGREDWDQYLWLNCHTKRADGGDPHSGHTDVYGRMKWDSPATGLTTRCISLSNGRFGHPEEDRAISVREAARLQTFPDSFVFTGSLNSMARQIGNAVPVRVAKVFGNTFAAHYRSHLEEKHG